VVVSWIESGEKRRILGIIENLSNALEQLEKELPTL
jgi:hypothetical protein